MGMTVAELIEVLHRAPLDAQVLVDVAQDMGEAVRCEPDLHTGRYVMAVHAVDREHFIHHNQVILEL